VKRTAKRITPRRRLTVEPTPKAPDGAITPEMIFRAEKLRVDTGEPFPEDSADLIREAREERHAKRDEFRLNQLQEQWASKKRPGVPASKLRKTLIAQKGLCALSQVALIFDVSERTPEKGGHGCHPLSPAVDHIDPGNPSGGFQIICYALNDLKGHPPLECFDVLRLREP